MPYTELTNIPASLLRRFAPVRGPAANDAPRFNYWRGASCQGWDARAFDALVSSIETAPAGSTIGIGHYMHGAATETEPGLSALVRTRGTPSYFFNANWQGSDPDRRHVGWVTGAIDRPRPYASPTYINYLSWNEATDVASSYGANYGRLRQLKAKYDPSNVFQLNRNIRPSLG